MIHKVKPSKKPTRCGGKLLPGHPLTLTDLVNDYVKPGGKRDWRRIYCQCLSLTNGAPINTLHKPSDIVTICVYGLHQNNKNIFVPMDAHQRRIAKSLPPIIKELKQLHIASKTFASFENFFDFITHVATAIRTKSPNFKFGPLANYDLASRLAIGLSKPTPKDYVYFQAGALEGINNLFNNPNCNVKKPAKARNGVQNYTILYNDLVNHSQFVPLSRLTADEIEDLCCVFKNELKTISLN